MRGEPGAGLLAGVAKSVCRDHGRDARVIMFMPGTGVVVFVLFLFLFKKETFLGIRQQSQKTFWVGGSLGFSAYAIVLWACLHAPISLVYTLRETSVLFAILLAIVFLKEKITLGKTLLIGVLCLGVVLIKSSQ